MNLHSHQSVSSGLRVIECSLPDAYVIASVSAPVVLAAFAKAVNTVEPYSPNHPAYASAFYVELYLVDGQTREFEFHTMQASDRTIYVDFVRRHGALTSYYGNCKSAALFDWMKEQTPNKSLQATAAAPSSYD